MKKLWDLVILKDGGTSLKPAIEPIVLARKPISEKTIGRECYKTWHGRDKYR